MFGKRAELLCEEVDYEREKLSVFLTWTSASSSADERKIQHSSSGRTLLRHEPRLLDIASRHPVVDFLDHLGEFGTAGRDEAGVPVVPSHTYISSLPQEASVEPKMRWEGYAQDPEVSDRVQRSVEDIQRVPTILEHPLEHMSRLSGPA